MDQFDEWRRLLDVQCGVVTRRQLLTFGITDATVRAHVAAGRWQPVHDGVYATFSGLLLPGARRWAAVSACWPCALSHETAGEHWRMTTPDPDGPIHVTVAYGRNAVRHDGVVVHRSRAFEHIVERSLDPPVVGRAFTAIDLAVAAPGAHDAMRLLLHILTVTRLRPASVVAALERRRPRRWRRALLDAVRYAQEGVTSALETIYAVDVEKAHGLPRALRQVPVLVDGVERYEDLMYRIGDEEVIVRLDGRRHHADEPVTILDRRRANAAEIAGRGHISFGWPEIQDPCATAREVFAVLVRRGYTDPFTRCGGCRM